MQTEPFPSDVNEFAIQHSAGLCRSKFRQILALVNQDEAVARRIPLLFAQPENTQPILTISDLRDEFEQFRVWADNIGVFASDHASLDYRLHEALDVKQGIVSLLHSLDSDLTEVSALLKEDQDYGDGDKPAPDADEEESSDDDTEALTDLEITCLEIQNQLDHISDLITKLIHLARVIRVSGVRSRATKAARYVHYDEYGINQTKVFEETYLPSVLRHRFQVTGPLLPRLCKVISSRRRQFMYQQTHQKRLAYDGAASDYAHFPATTLLLPDQTPPSQQLGPAVTQISGANVTDHHKPALSTIYPPTLATTFRMTELKRLAPSTIVASTMKLAMNTIDFPQPPSVSDKATHFQCPYCCLLVEVRKRAPATWRKHLLNDLKPFMCIEPTCSDPYVVLETWNDWVEHHRWTHAMEWWCEGIEPDHPPSRFTNPEEYSDHLLSDHMSSLSLCAVARMVNGGGGPSQEPFKSCPFCDFQWHGNISASSSLMALETAKARQSQLQSHIFDHLISMFMLALPEREDLEDSVCDDDQSGLRRGSVLVGLRTELSDHSPLSSFGAASQPESDSQRSRQGISDLPPAQPTTAPTLPNDVPDGAKANDLEEFLAEIPKALLSRMVDNGVAEPTGDMPDIEIQSSVEITNPKDKPAPINADDEQAIRERAERSLRRKRARQRAQQVQGSPQRSAPPTRNLFPLPESGSSPVRAIPSMDLEGNSQEHFLFELRKCTHEVWLQSRWDANPLAGHDRGTQYCRSLVSDLTAGVDLFEDGRHESAWRYWNFAFRWLQNPDLFKTYQPEVPMRLLFESGRLVSSGHERLAKVLLKHIRNWACYFLDNADPRYALFACFADIDPSSLKDLHPRAARLLFEGLETRLPLPNSILVELRFTTTLDLLWNDPNLDLSEWIPSDESIHTGVYGHPSPWDSYSHLLQAYAFIAKDSYDEASGRLSQATATLSAAEKKNIDSWHVAWTYLRIGQLEFSKGRHTEARRNMNTALRYSQNEVEISRNILAQICLHQLRMAQVANDQEDVYLWSQMLENLERQAHEKEKEEGNEKETGKEEKRKEKKGKKTSPAILPPSSSLRRRPETL